MADIVSLNLLNLKNHLFNTWWHPTIQERSALTNDITLDDPRNMIITGPNVGGKSTFIKSITLSLVFSQTLGLSWYKHEVNTI